MSKIQKNKAIQAKSEQAIVPMNETSAEEKAVETAIQALLALGQLEQAEQVRCAYEAFKAEQAAQAKAVEEQAAQAQAQAILASLPFALKPVRSEPVTALRGTLVSMPNKSGSSAHRINQAILQAIDSGAPITLASLQAQADCSVRRVLGHLGKAKTAINGKLSAEGLALVVNDYGAYLKSADGAKTVLYTAK